MPVLTRQRLVRRAERRIALSAAREVLGPAPDRETRPADEPAAREGVSTGPVTG